MIISRINKTQFPRHRSNVNTTNKAVSIKKINHIQKRSEIITVKSFNNDVTAMSYIVGKGIIAFTFFYTSLNYIFYKRLREDYEKQTKDDDEKKQ